MSENGEIYTADKNFTLPPALTAWTNSTSAGRDYIVCQGCSFYCQLSKVRTLNYSISGL